MLNSCVICFIKKVIIYFLMSFTVLNIGNVFNIKGFGMNTPKNTIQNFKYFVSNQNHAKVLVSNPLVYSLTLKNECINSTRQVYLVLQDFIQRVHYTNFHNPVEEKEFYYNLKKIETNSRKNSIYLNILIYVALYYFYWNLSVKLKRKYSPYHSKNRVHPRITRHEIYNNRIGINDTINDSTEKIILNGLVKFEEKNFYLQKSITLGKLATELNTNVKYLSIVIKKHKAENFNHYLNSLRINYIVDMLKKDEKFSRYKISHLSDLCGYSSPAAFTKSFIEIMRITPSDFIKNIEKNN